MNALPVEIDDSSAVPLVDSEHLYEFSEAAAALSLLYGRGSLRRSIDGKTWRFQWRSLTEPLTGVLLVLRIGSARALVMIENMEALGSASDVERDEMPASLRAIYLNGVGASVWQELEAITQRAVEVLEVRLDTGLTSTPDCLGFEVGLEPSGPATRGFLRLMDSDAGRNSELHRVLADASAREMVAVRLFRGIPIRWTVVLGSTRLSAGEVGELEAHDIVLVDDARPTPDGMKCWLGVGPARRYAGGLTMRNGQLLMNQFGTGDSNMSSDIDVASKQETGFEDVPVTLRFELAQWNAPLAEVGKLAPGAVLDLGQRVDENAVSVWVEQRCIGKGQLVAIGERLGVRLLSIFASDRG